VTNLVASKCDTTLVTDYRLHATPTSTPTLRHAIINLGTCVTLPPIVPGGGADSVDTRNHPDNRHRHHLRGDDPVSAVGVEGVLRSVVGGEGGGEERIVVSYKVEGSDPVVETGIDAVGAVLFADCDGGV